MIAPVRPRVVSARAGDRMDTSAFTGKFVEEARDRLKSLGIALVRLEAEPQSAEIIAEIFRDAHSLKGSAQMLGFVDISHIAHQLEDLFVAAKRDVRVIDGRAIDLVFRSLDLIAARVEELASGKTAPGTAPDVAPASETPAARPRRRPAAGQSLRVAIEKLDSLTHLAPEMVIQSLKASERHTELRRVEFSIARLRDRVREARLAPPTRSRAAELGEYADTLDSITRRMRSLVTNFSDDQARLTLITEELRQHVIDLTMLPVGTVFDTFPRAVRDLSRSFDKEVELTMTGRETELEKRVIEKIADPLVHLVRNAIDHGLESPDDRKRAGKPPAGALLIAAEQHGNRCHITVRDDGRGIDPAALRAAAVRKGRRVRVRARPVDQRAAVQPDLRARFQHPHRNDRRLGPWRGHGRGARGHRLAGRRRPRAIRARSRHHGGSRPAPVARAAARRADRGQWRDHRHSHLGDPAHPAWRGRNDAAWPGGGRSKANRFQSSRSRRCWGSPPAAPRLPERPC